MGYSSANQKRRQEIRKTGPKPRPLKDRLWEKIEVRGSDECWPWLGAHGNHTRQPTISNRGQQLTAYRVVFEDSYGPLEKDEWVLHTCDDRFCMNPRHMYVGDRIAWAQKWHGIVYDEAHHERRLQAARDKTRAWYQENKAAKQQYVLEYQMRNKIRAVNYLGGKCPCGQDHPSALQFHHRDPATKLFSVTSKELSSPKKYPWATAIVPELEKCDLLCSVCHTILEAALPQERIEELKRQAEKKDE